MQAYDVLVITSTGQGLRNPKDTPFEDLTAEMMMLTWSILAALLALPGLFSASYAAASTRSACCSSKLLYQDRKKSPYSVSQLPPELKNAVSHAGEL